MFGVARLGPPFLTRFAAALYLIAAFPVMAAAQGVGTRPPLEAAPGGLEGTAAAQACDPEVYRALADSAAFGVEQDLVIIRNPDQGIRDPTSILDFSCIEDLFNYRAFNVLFDPGRALEEILGLAERRICALARETYREYVGRKPDAYVFTSRVPWLPGLDFDPVGGNILEDASGDRSRFEKIIRGQ